MANAPSSGPPPRPKDTLATRRVFGFFLVLAVAGFGWSLTHQPVDPTTAAAHASDIGHAYAACQADVRKTAPPGASLTFPGEPESVEDAGENGLKMGSSVAVISKLGVAYTQHYTCSTTRAKGGWNVSRMAMDLPVS